MRQLLMQRGIAHLRAHAIAYAALFFAITGSATAVTGIQSASQDKSEDKVLAYPGNFVRPGSEETLLRANRIKVVGICATDSAEVRIGPVQEDGGTQRTMTVYADSHTLGYVRRSATNFTTIGSAPDDRGSFNAFNNNVQRGSLDGSFLTSRGDGGCTFEASAIAS